MTDVTATTTVAAPAVATPKTYTEEELGELLKEKLALEGKVAQTTARLEELTSQAEMGKNALATLKKTAGQLELANKELAIVKEQLLGKKSY